MIEESLSKIARQIMALSEETLTALVPRYKERMMNFAPTREWEESVIIYFLINGLRTKNSMFNDKIKDYLVTDSNGEPAGPRRRPRLRLVKAGRTGTQIEAQASAEAPADTPADAPRNTDPPTGGDEDHPQ